MNPYLVYYHRFSDHDDQKKREPKSLPEDKGMIIPDQSPNNPKLYDRHGFMQSDVSLLFAAVQHNDLPLQKAISDRMQMTGESSYLPESLTDDQMFESTPSRFAQSPSELADQAERISNVVDVGIQNDPSPSDNKSDDTISFEGNENLSPNVLFSFARICLSSASSYNFYVLFV